MIPYAQIAMQEEDPCDTSRAWLYAASDADLYFHRCCANACLTRAVEIMQGWQKWTPPSLDAN